ncbi:putative RNA-directed DNA polymerase from transposon BS [Papilio machaon]|uniref:Putative RNA-directed DNA polymerase from transposon BS n=1 Tax=Papilio machaon TaxID=76193 RepID=A0A194QKM3_PAPMA|nr:putative RNA-directed DNA polymerase from transposon BS [Papilio machaon]
MYYKNLKTLVINSIHNEKRAYFDHNINNNLHKPKILWHNLKSTILPPNKYTLPAHLADPDNINCHFLNIPGIPRADPSTLSYFDTHLHPNNTFFSLHPVSELFISKIINNLKSNAEGIDGITLKMLLMTLPQSLSAITSIVNCSITSSTFPKIWKTAIIRPLPKNPNPQELKDLRPISVLPFLSKIVEKVVWIQLTDYLENNNILPEFQSGFRKSHSTTTALLDVTDNIISAQDEGLCTLLVLLDFSRAFDCIDISLLLSKMSYYGFKSDTVQWFQSFLTNRGQCVEITRDSGQTQRSAYRSLERGTPQGTILSPLLFILYTADIIKCIENCKYHLYADDLQIYVSFRSGEWASAVRSLNEDLDRIQRWSENNCLVLNPSKTKYMIFGSQYQINNIPPDCQVTLGSEVVERVYEAKNLGLLLEPSLRYEKHISGVVRSCFYRLKVLYKVRRYLSERLRIQLVEALVLSKLNYSDAVYGPRLYARTEKLIQRVQNACARFCFSIPPRNHVTPFLNEHNMLKITYRRKLHLACLLFEIINTEAPKYLSNKLIFTRSRGSEQGRRFPQLCTQRHKSAVFRGSFRYAATKCWNNIPPPIKSARTKITFKSTLHLEMYKSSCRPRRN